MKKIATLVLITLFSSVNGINSPLPAQEAFRLKANLIDPNTVLLQFDIKEGYFLYKKRFHLTPSKSISLGPLRLPNAVIKKDIDNNTFSIYRTQLLFPLAILSHERGNASISINYQGCADSGFCYPPTEQILSLDIDNSHAISKVSLNPPGLKKIRNKGSASSANKKDIDGLFKQQDFWLTLLSFFGFGLLLSFTPCVLPMIPVLSGIIVGHKKTMSPRKAFLLSLSYVSSMALTYALVGMMIALAGKNLQASLQSPWAIGLFSLTFVALALSMFGFYELRLPVELQSKIANFNKKQEGGGYIGAAIMGALSTLILSPCVTAPLVGALSYIANTGDVVLGGLSLLFLGFGMGVPLILIGTSFGKLLPKAGAWMNTVKSLFGVLLLAVAIYLVSRILPSFITMILWAMLMIIPSVYLGAFSKNMPTNPAIITKGFGLTLFVYGVLVLVGAALGNHDPLKPLESPAPLLLSRPNQGPLVVTNLVDAKRALDGAKGKKVMLDFYADWCASCVAMESHVFSDPAVQKALANVAWIKADVTANNDSNIQLENHFKVVAPPTFIFFNAQGKETVRIIGETNKESIIRAIAKN